MGKSISDYYAERMQKLLEAQKQGNTSSRLSAPSSANIPGRTAKASVTPARSRYEDIKRERAAKTAEGRTSPEPRRQASYAPPRAAVNRPTESSQRAANSRKAPEQTVADKKREELSGIEAMQKARRGRRRRKLRDAFISFVLILAVFGAMSFVVYRLLFVISDINAEGSEYYSSDDIVTASGVSEGDHLYSFRSSVAGMLISHRCPQIESIAVSRRAPSKIVFKVNEEPCKYYTDFYGEYRAVSPTLRVLHSLTLEEAESAELIRLRLPAVQSAVAGETPQFATLKNESYIYDTAEAVSKSALADRINSIDLRSKYDIRLVCDGKYLMSLGDSDSIETKLRIAESVLEDEMFSGDDKARIDLSDLSKTSVVVDNQLTFD